ncbi:AAA family ATPase [Glutamicibacter sp. 287]|uniref:AAA family ATPase n=1 Tax=unclassified Glutamicibacter TaxID=2627139 RepID=UPI000BB8DCF3|nr:AAA family ATPase [Glutamicibacter sp. BW80]
MAKIRVSNGRFGLSLTDALRRAKQGDELQLKEGEYVVDSVSLSNLKITGLGDSSKVVIFGQLSIQGTCQIANVTIQAPPYHNALTVRDSQLELQSSQIHGEPAGKYPAIYASSSTVSMVDSNVFTDRAASSIEASSNSVLFAKDSGIGLLTLTASKATTSNVFSFAIVALERSRVDCAGFLELHPAEGRRSLRIEGESACSIELLRAQSEPLEGYCQDGYLKIGNVLVREGQKYLLVTKNAARIDIPAVGTATKNLDTSTAEPQPVEPPMPTVQKPKVILWDLKDARDFANAVAPKLNKGDTIMLEEGEYFLEQYEHFILMGADIAGRGRAERTILHGGIRIMDKANIRVSNLTIRPKAASNAVFVAGDESVNLVNVIIQPAPGAEKPAVVAIEGLVQMSDCRIAADSSAVAGSVDIGDGARLEAENSFLGWVNFWNAGQGQLVDCSAYRLWAETGSTVKSHGVLTIQVNECNMRAMVVKSNSTVRGAEVKPEATYAEIYVSESTLAIKDLKSPDTATVGVLGEDDAILDVTGNAVEIRNLDTEMLQETGPVVSVEPSSDASSQQLAQNDRTNSDTSAKSEVAQSTEANPLTELDNLTGLRTVKQQIATFTQMVQFNKMRQEQGLKTTGISMHSLFLGNPGTGKTTVARMLGDALYAAGAIEKNNFIEVGRPDLVGQHLGASAIMTQKALDKARGGILFVDEAYSLHQKEGNSFGQEAVDTILAYMENHRESIVVIFAGYANQMQDFLNMNPGLKSRIPNRFDFEDYSALEIAEIGYRSLLEADYTVDEQLYRRTVTQKYGQAADRSNGRWVRNFNEELVKQMAGRVFGQPSHDEAALTHITAADFEALLGGDAQAKQQKVDELLAELDRLVGLGNVKQWVRKLVNRVKIDQQRQQLGEVIARPSYHMVFAGNPGTGKTTVAKLIGQIFFNLGLLESPTVKTVDRAQLVGKWVGHTEEQTSRVIEEAMGGVLFVDEAYQLTDGSHSDFGRQAVETFVTRLEEDRDKFVAIFAGYTESMERFLKANPGLPSRIPLRIEFLDYSPAEIAQIVQDLLARNWSFDPDALADTVMSAYASLDPGARANGRWARNFVERVESEHIDYVATNHISAQQMKYISTELIRKMGQ